MGSRRSKPSLAVRAVWVLGAAASVALLLAACDGGTSSRENGGDAGSASGGPGSGAKGGSASGGTSSGSQQTAGEESGGAAQAGSQPIGGSASEGGSDGELGGQAGMGTGGEPSGSLGAECDVDDDCTVFDDCCQCSAAPKSNPPQACEKLCIQDTCTARSLDGLKARCHSHRCVFAVSCNSSQVTCEAATPVCDAGAVPSVNGTCWGPCVPVEDCSDVSDCSDCAKGQVCVQNQDSPLSFTQCVEVTKACAAAPSCECTDACPRSCNDASGIQCFCPTC